MTDNERIDELLNAAADPVQRAIVVVLASINRDLQAQTAATNALTKQVQEGNVEQKDLDAKISQHMIDEEVMLAGFKGRASLAIWIAPLLFSLLSILGSYIWLGQATALRELIEKVDDTRTRQRVNEERIGGLERRQNADEVLRQMQPKQ